MVQRLLLITATAVALSSTKSIRFAGAAGFNIFNSACVAVGGTSTGPTTVSGTNSGDGSQSGAGSAIGTVSTFGATADGAGAGGAEPSRWAGVFRGAGRASEGPPMLQLVPQA